ncbi:hypothetical protein THTE_2805 [Thermogutta terrifontis]|uniref:Uncharacterized protein n=1 Tax=Thermogutta terrifontis TaxID=1331910 RepID=A0A286RHH9_9BACT|nr:hypothetical protein THTE_2805 [Thermogutta terrifontis]
MSGRPDRNILDSATGRIGITFPTDELPGRTLKEPLSCAGHRKTDWGPVMKISVGDLIRSAQDGPQITRCT